jgi:hypothetical protein
MNTERELLAADVAEIVGPQLEAAVDRSFERMAARYFTEENARNVFAIGVRVLQEEAKRSAGEFMLGGVWKLLKWGLTGGMLLLLAFMLGGPKLMGLVWGLIKGSGA